MKCLSTLSLVAALAPCTLPLMRADTAFGSTMGSDITASTLQPDAFYQRLHVLNQGQIALGELAVRRGSSQAVKDFGKVVADDHRSLETTTSDQATAHHVSVADASLVPKVQDEQKALAKTLDQLAKASPQSFDERLLKTAIDTDERALALTKEADDTLKWSTGAPELARAVAPVLRKHEAMAKDTLAQLQPLEKD